MPPKANKTRRKRTPPASLRQERMIVALLQYPSVDEACRRAKVSRTTYYEWMKDRSFRNALTERRRAAFGESLDTIKAGLRDAAVELRRLVKSKNERVRLAAVKVQIDAATRAHEMLDIEERLSALESASSS